MIRKLFTVIIMLSVLGWIVFSYLPASMVSLPKLTLIGSDFSTLFPALVAICFGLFLLIQLWLVAATPSIVRSAQKLFQQDQRQGFRLNLGAELFWTIAPLLMTLALGVAVYQLYLAQPTP